MSKQSHDQNDNQTPSGDTSSQSPPASSDVADNSKSGTRSRSRRRTKAESDGARQSAGNDAQRDAKAETSPVDAAVAKPAQSAAASGTSTEAAKPSEDSSSNKSSSASSSNKSSSASSSNKSSGATSSKKPASQNSGRTTTGSTTPPPGKQPPTGKHSSSGGGTTPPRDGGTSSSRYGVIALVLVVLLGIALLLAAWQGWQRLDAQQQRIAELETQSSESASRDELSALQGRLDDGARERDDVIAEVRDAFADYRSEVDGVLDQVLDELSSEQEADEREWLHAEATYLLRLANQRLQLERDVVGAAALLRTADGRLRDADNPALTPVRREISSELAALDAVPQIDRTGLYLALDAQQEQLARLPLNQDIEQIAAESGIEQPPTGTWQQQLSRFGAELRDLVTVRRHDEALEALIAPEQEAYLRQNVRLLIEQAQLALLKEEEALYEASLDKALALIEAFYATDRDNVQRALERLGELREAAIRPELPDISASQQVLSEFIERRFNGGANEAGSAEGDAR